MVKRMLKVPRAAEWLVDAAKAHPLLALVLLALTAVPLGWLVAAAAPPNPGVTQFAMSWQAAPGPFLNTGANKDGLTLEQWKRGLNVQGQTLEAWVAAGNDESAWVADPSTKALPEDYRPLPTKTVKQGAWMYILRYHGFPKKLSTPRIERSIYCGSGQSYDLPSVAPPKLTSDARAVSNHATKLPPDMMPPGVNSMMCVYKARAEFIQNIARTATMYFPDVPVLIVR